MMQFIGGVLAGSVVTFLLLMVIGLAANIKDN